MKPRCEESRYAPQSHRSPSLRITKIVLLYDKAIFKTEVRIDDIGYSTSCFPKSVFINQIDPATAIIRMNNVEHCTNIARVIVGLTDHVPHSVNLLLSAQVESDIYKTCL